MHDFSVLMGIVDMVPVFFFGAAAVLLQQGLYNKMYKGCYALFAAGTINVFIAGFLKATWKILYSFGVCDFAALNTMFFPVQSIGFLLAGLGILGMFFKPKSVTASVAPAVFSGTFLFVGLMVAGLGCMSVGLCIAAAKMKKKWVIALFLLSFVCSLGMGYLSSKDFTEAAMNWIAEGVNSVGQAALFFGAWALHKAGLRDADFVTKKS